MIHPRWIPASTATTTTWTRRAIVDTTTTPSWYYNPVSSHQPPTIPTHAGRSIRRRPVRSVVPPTISYRDISPISDRETTKRDSTCRRTSCVRHVSVSRPRWTCRESRRRILPWRRACPNVAARSPRADCGISVLDAVHPIASAVHAQLDTSSSSSSVKSGLWSSLSAATDPSLLTMIARESPELQHVTLFLAILTAQAVVPSNKPELTKSMSVLGEQMKQKSCDLAVRSWIQSTNLRHKACSYQKAARRGTPPKMRHPDACDGPRHNRPIMFECVIYPPPLTLNIIQSNIWLRINPNMVF